jgi:uncharacterized protein YpmB
MKFFFKDLTDRKWLTIIVVILLIFALLAWSIWLYYSYQIQRLEMR